ncbi:colicin E3 [Alteromonas sp. MYP5]|uniref:Colicin E3 n=1 Tax=Alteromonas ponticola TaxID=2720613 RepID=A0ABX1R3F8_9ALTE|nr:colicin E3 [Alteromonas ponticola]
MDSSLKYIPPPKEIDGINGLKSAKPKTAIQGGGGLRKRWKDKKGNIYEWDSQHGTVEKYNKQGKHLGEFDPNTGE